MPRRFTNLPEHMREPNAVRWSDLPSWYWLMVGIALLIGLVTGILWIGWNLLTIHVLGWR